MVRQVPEVAQDAGVAAILAALAAGDGQQAESLCRRQLDAAPDSVDYLRLLGRALLVQDRPDEAERALRRILALRPEFAPAHEDLGGVQIHQRRYEQAVETLQAALRLDPKLPQAGKKLGQALAALGRGAEADSAFEAWFGQRPERAALAIALDHLRADRKAEAIVTLRSILRQDHDDVDALVMLAQAHWGDEKRHADVEAMLRRVTTLAPRHVLAWSMLGSLLQDTNRFEEALDCYRRVVDIEPANASAWSGLGANHAQLGDVERSADAYARALQLKPGLPGIHLSYAHTLKSLGRQAESLREYRTAIAQKPEFGEAYWSMANLKVFRFEREEVAAMEAQLKREDLSESARAHFHFALGKAYEDAGDFSRAFEHYHAGNLRQRPLVSYDPVGFEARHVEIADVFSREFLDRHAGVGCDSDAPIFIVGLPRSGSTLIEQILASHSQVEGTQELSILGDIAVATGRYQREDREYPRSLLTLHDRDFRDCGRQYIDLTRSYRKTGKPRFTDKLPNNFSHVGFAHLILPNATVINARRHPLDSCLGSYKQLFARGQNFTYDMSELALYYRQYHETMKHWHRVLPGKVLDVHYEETVLNLEGQVRRILAHCGLPYEDACLRFYETRRPVRTASSEQVRRPLYADSLGAWRRYAEHLGPWQEELSDIIAELPDSVRNAGL